MKQLQDQGFLIHSSRVDVNDLDSPSFSKPLECTDFTVNQGPKWSEEDSPSPLQPPDDGDDDDMDPMLGKREQDCKNCQDWRCSVLNIPPCHAQLFCPSTTKEGGSTKLPPLHDRSQESSGALEPNIIGNTYLFTSFSCSFQVGHVTCANEGLAA